MGFGCNRSVPWQIETRNNSNKLHPRKKNSPLLLVRRATMAYKREPYMHNYAFAQPKNEQIENETSNAIKVMRNQRKMNVSL